MSDRSLGVFHRSVEPSSLGERTEAFRYELETAPAPAVEPPDDVPHFESGPYVTVPTIPCISTDGRGVIRAVNGFAAPLLGFDAARLPGKPLLHFVPRGATRAFRDFVRRIEEIADGPAISVQLRPRGGKPATFEARVVRLTVDSFDWYFHAER